MDAKYGENFLYENVVRPIIHGTYHGARYLCYEAQQSFDLEELAWAKHQLSANGRGQLRTYYSKEHREQQDRYMFATHRNNNRSNLCFAQKFVKKCCVQIDYINK